MQRLNYARKDELAISSVLCEKTTLKNLNLVIPTVAFRPTLTFVSMRSMALQLLFSLCNIIIFEYVASADSSDIPWPCKGYWCRDHWNTPLPGGMQFCWWTQGFARNNGLFSTSTFKGAWPDEAGSLNCFELTSFYCIWTFLLIISECGRYVRGTEAMLASWACCVVH